MMFVADTALYTQLSRSMGVNLNDAAWISATLERKVAGL